MANLLDSMPPALKSLWNLENELRSALQNAVFMRKEEASQHMAEAKRHLESALASINKSGAVDKDAETKTSTGEQKLDYGEGPRADYGEGYKYRKEDLTKGADNSTEHKWAGGDHDRDEQNPTPPGQELGAKKP